MQVTKCQKAQLGEIRKKIKTDERSWILLEIRLRIVFYMNSDFLLTSKSQLHVLCYKFVLSWSLMEVKKQDYVFWLVLGVGVVAP